MNTMLIVLVCAFIAMASCAPDAEFLKYSKKCMEETGVPEEMVMNTAKGIFSDDKVLAKYFVCIGIKGGAMDAAGNIDKAVLKKRMRMFFDDQDLINAAVEKCSDKKATVEETALESPKCLFKELSG